MKKVYYSFVLVLMALMSMNVMADTPIKLDGVSPKTQLQAYPLKHTIS